MLRSLKVRDFRCFDSFEAAFAPGLNLIVGPNARGKTSLLEAACVLLRLQSPRTSRLQDVVRHDKRGFVVDGYVHERRLQFYFSAERKKLALDAVEQKSSRSYLEIGRVVVFSTGDIDLIRGAAEVRRRYLDFAGTQEDVSYARHLRSYERALRSRNALLKAPSTPWRQIAAFDEPLLSSGNELKTRRRALVEALQPGTLAAHRAISASRESVLLSYAPAGGADFSRALEEARAEDARLRQTTVGPHRDELGILINGKASRFASEGQQRTVTLALKLAVARLLHQRFGAPPLLLLDDIFGELDLPRRAALLGALPSGSQKLVTLTHLDWLPAGLETKVLELS